jgi:hypothetical protein
MNPTSCCPEVNIGSNPAYTKWNIVRGDTGKIRIEFLQNDETTYFTTTNWIYTSSTYDSRGDFIDELTTIPGEGYVDIVAPADITANWGTGFLAVVAELAFDLEVILPNGDVWTPVIGSISVMGDISGGAL